MFKQMVQFSKQLQESGFYDSSFEDSKQFFYVVMPLEDKTKLYFVVDDELYENLPPIDSMKKMSEVSDDLRKVLRNVEELTRKLPGDEMGNKSIMGNKGVNSYNLFIFQLPKEGKKSLEEKLQVVYKEKRLEFLNIVDEKILDKLVLEDSEAKFIADKVKGTIATIEADMKAKKKSTNFLKNTYFVFELPDTSLYENFYYAYLRNKVFLDESGKFVRDGTCSICGKEDKVSIPVIFHNMNSKKLFISHIGRKESLNTLICRDCSLELVKFYQKFLRKINIFPLFIDEDLEDEEIDILRNIFEGGPELRKNTFREILKNVASQRDVLDFYLIISGRQDFVFVDYVSNFRYNFSEDATIFDIEDELNTLFEDKLKFNYFGSSTLKDERLVSNIYKYRELIFDFVYRAKIENINKDVIDNIFYDSLAKKLREFYDDKSGDGNKEQFAVIRLFDSYKKLNKHFGGDYMDKVESLDDLWNREKLENSYEYYYLLGQITRYLLSQSQSGSKTHALVEPFMNVSSPAVMMDRVFDLFNKYKHNIDIDDAGFNKAFMLVLNYFNTLISPENVTDNSNKAIQKNEKFFFFEGYFSGKLFSRWYKKMEGTENVGKLENSTVENS